MVNSQAHKNSKKVCENCGKDLNHYSDEDWFGSQHHIIEKSKINGCPSVATVLENHGVLCKWDCHAQWHTSQSNAEKMPFFKIAKKGDLCSIEDCLRDCMIRVF